MQYVHRSSPTTIDFLDIRSYKMQNEEMNVIEHFISVINLPMIQDFRWSISLKLTLMQFGDVKVTYSNLTLNNIIQKALGFVF